MADSTIANLTDGTTADATDRLPVERSPFGAGTNRYVTPAYLRTYLNFGVDNTTDNFTTLVHGFVPKGKGKGFQT